MVFLLSLFSARPLRHRVDQQLQISGWNITLLAIKNLGEHQGKVEGQREELLVDETSRSPSLLGLSLLGEGPISPFCCCCCFSLIYFNHSTLACCILKHFLSNQATAVCTFGGSCHKQIWRKAECQQMNTNGYPLGWCSLTQMIIRRLARNQRSRISNRSFCIIQWQPRWASCPVWLRS